MSLPQELANRMEPLARKMCFSKDSIAHFKEVATPGQARAFCELLDFEMGVREQNKLRRLMRKAAFPVVKSADGFDFSEVAFPEGYAKDDMLSLEFIERAQDFVFYGKTGRGKTHLAIAVGMAAVNSGYEVLYHSTASLVRKLSSAHARGELDLELKALRHADLIILDEFGYIPIDADGARLLFQVVSESYEARSLILTTNIEFSKWATVLGDEKMAAAMIDRIVHHGRLIEFNGSSKRMDRSLMLGKGDD